MQVNIQIKNKNVTFPLMNNEFVKEMLIKKDNVNLWTLRKGSWPIVNVKQPNNEYVLNEWKLLKNTYNNLLSLTNVTDKIGVPDEFDYTTYYINKLHRVFTTALTYNQIFNQKIFITNEIYKLINNINDFCHNIEPYILTDHKKLIFKSKVHFYEMQSNLKNNTTIINCHRYNDLITDDADVFAVKHITGKDFITAFFDHDNPNEWDVVNTHVTYPGFLFDIDDHIKNFWKSNEFKSWLIKHNCDKKIGYIPIAKLTIETKLKLKQLFEQPVENLNVNFLN